MSIASEITRLQGAKSDLKTSIEGKGVTVPSATKIDGYAALVDQIQTGGGGGHTGTVDTAGLQALGWDAQDIQWLQDHVWWDAEDDAEWAVTEANKAFGPAGATPLTWSNYTAQKYNPDLRYFPKLTTPTGTSMSSKFSGFMHLVAIPTHGWDMSAITNYQTCFNNSPHLRSFGDISYWVTSVTTTISSMFGQCFSLEEVDVSHWDTKNVTNMASAFNSCASLKSIDLSNWNFAKVPSLGSFCANCYALRSITFPATINAPLLTTASSVFTGCASLEAVDLNLVAASLTTVNSIFSTNYNLQRAKLSLSSTVLSNIGSLFYPDYAITEIDLTGIDTTSCNQTGAGSSHFNSPFGVAWSATTIKLGANFFKGTFTTLYANQCYSWSRDSIYESLYTNQTSRSSSSPAVTINLAAAAYDRLSASDLSDIATKNFTLTRV